MRPASVLLPIYNGIQYIDRCIVSILEQIFQNFELIIVDDGSTDGSEAICDEYAERDSRVCVIHKKNGGVSNARNTGLKMAEGDYIAFCDGDDYFEKNLLETSLSEAQKTGADIVTFWAYRTSIGKAKKDNYVINYDIVDLKNNRESFIEDVVSWKTGGWQVWRSIFKKEIIQKHDVEFCETSNDYAEDLGFTIEYLLYAGKNAFIDNELYIYDDIRENSITNRSKKKCMVNEANEVSYFLHDKIRIVLPEKSAAKIHHKMIISEMGKLYSGISKEQFKRWISAIKNIDKLDYFLKQNTAYLQDSYGKIRLRDLTNPVVILDRYLSSLSFPMLIGVYCFNRLYFFAYKIKEKLTCIII